MRVRSEAYQGRKAHSGIGSVVSLGVATWADNAGRPWQSMVFVTLTTSQLGVAMGMRARQGLRSNAFLLLAVGGSLGLVLAGIYLPPLRELLETSPLSWTEATIAVVAGVVGWFAVRVDRSVKARRAHRSR